MKMFTVDLMGTGRMLILGEEGVNSGREALEKLLRRSFHSCDLSMAGHHHGPSPVGILVDDAFVMRVQGMGTRITHLVADAGRGMWTVAESTRVHPAHPEYRPLDPLALSHRTLLELHPAEGHAAPSALDYRERLIAGLLLGSVFAPCMEPEAPPAPTIPPGFSFEKVDPDGTHVWGNGQGDLRFTPCPSRNCRCTLVPELARRTVNIVVNEVTPPPAEPITPARNAANIMQRWARLDFKEPPQPQPTAAQVQEVARQLVKLAQVAAASCWGPCPGCGLLKAPFVERRCVGAYLACRTARTGVPEGEQVSASTSKLEWAKDLTRVPLVVRVDDQSEPP